MESSNPIEIKKLQTNQPEIKNEFRLKLLKYEIEDKKKLIDHLISVILESKLCEEECERNIFLLEIKNDCDRDSFDNNDSEDEDLNNHFSFEEIVKLKKTFGRLRYNAKKYKSLSHNLSWMKCKLLKEIDILQFDVDLLEKDLEE